MSRILTLKLIAFFAIAIHVFVPASGQATPILVGDWKMNDGSGAKLSDESGDGNHAFLQNTNDITWGAGKYGLALFLPGTTNRFAIAPNTASLNIASKITIAAWINPTEVRNATILGKTGPDGYELAINSKGKIEFSFNSNSYPDTFYIASTSTYPSDGSTWIHIAATYDGAVSRIYINGILNATVNFRNPVPIKTNTSGLYIGSLSGSRRWKGGLDEVRLYNGALNEAEIGILAGIDPPSAPALLAPINASVNMPLNPTLSWQPVSGAIKYRAEVSRDANFSSFDFEADNISNSSVQVSNVVHNTLYYWRIRATNGGGNGSWSSAWSFTTAPPPVVPPTLSLVTINSNNNNNTALAKPGDIISLKFTAAEPINTPVVTIAGHAVTTVAGSGNSFTATCLLGTGDVSGNVSFSIDFSNTAGTAGITVTSTTNASTVTFDKTSPTVETINRQSPLSSVTNATVVVLRSTFSEIVNGVDPGDFLLTITGGTLTGTISTVNAVTAGVYDITISSLGGNGTLRLDLKGTGTGITDEAGNLINGGFVNGQTYSIQQSAQPGFSSILPLAPLDITKETKDKPQAKTWKYANKWWCVLSVSTGTKIFRLDGTTWTSVLTLTDKNCKPDCIVADNLVHILCYKDVSLFYTVEYDAASNSYKLWHLRPATSTSTIRFPVGSQTATIVLDGNGRLWAATDSQSEISVWWSDAPYTTWSAPVTIASGIKDDDMCSLVAIPGQNKIGVFWSNQSTKRFGFRTHLDGTSPAAWTVDEKPVSQSALNFGKGMADNHMNLKVTSDGTVYCAAKTGYDKSGYPHLVLLIRRPSGNWDNAYTITTYPDGTQPALLLNETRGKLKIVYTTATNGGNVVYRESSLSPISFSTPIPLISTTSSLLNYPTSSHQNYDSDVVVLATDITSTPMRAVGVLCTDPADPSPSQSIVTRLQTTKLENFVTEDNSGLLTVHPNPFQAGTTFRFGLKETGAYTLAIHDINGRQIAIVDRGWAEAGKEQKKYFNKAIPGGIYLATLKTGDGTSVIKLLKN